MKTLHILRAEPDPLARRLIDGISRGEAKNEVALYQGPLDYDRLVADIFAADKVICWWAPRVTA